ncbi:MAG TPA: peptidoglycan-binding domain-containing protein, partial [Rhodanobacter sp.]
MDTLRKGDQGPQVTQLQQLLVQRGYAAPASGSFDTRTRQAVRAFQAQNLDQHGQPLVVDGVAGPLTWWSLKNPKPTVATPTAVDYAALPASGGSARGRAALAAAIGELQAGAC